MGLQAHIKKRRKTSGFSQIKIHFNQNSIVCSHMRDHGDMVHNALIMGPITTSLAARLPSSVNPSGGEVQANSATQPHAL